MAAARGRDVESPEKREGNRLARCAHNARMLAAERHAEHLEGYRYERRRPEERVLCRVVSAYWPAFRERVEELGSLPKFVVREVDEYLRCGLLEYGFIRVRRADCGFERLVGFSCKRRGFCPSCLGRV
jgi:Transposase zinc-binding domain